MSRRKFLVRSAVTAGLLFTAPALLFRSSKKSLHSRSGFKALIEEGGLSKMNAENYRGVSQLLSELEDQGISVDAGNLMKYNRGNIIAPAVKTNVFSSEGWVFITRDKLSGNYRSAFLEERYMDGLDGFADGYISGMVSNGHRGNHARFILPDRLVSQKSGSIEYINGYGKRVTLKKCKGRLNVMIA